MDFLGGYASDSDNDGAAGGILADGAPLDDDKGNKEKNEAPLEERDTETVSTPQIDQRDYPNLDELPQVVTEGVKPETLALLGQYLEAQRQHNFDLTASIQGNKDFRNPAILIKVVTYFQIDELGSNYPKDLFDPLEIKRRNDPPQSDSNSPEPSVRATGEPIKFIAGASENSSHLPANKPKRSRFD